MAFSARFSDQSRMHYLEFERPIAELEGKIVELRKLAEDDPTMDIDGDVARLHAARGPDGARHLCPADALAEGAGGAPSRAAAFPGLCQADLRRIHAAGRRPRLWRGPGGGGGLARFRGRAVAFIGQEKGNDTKTRLQHNFGLAMPEGYRKAVRIFELADRFGLPVLSFCDTSGAYPGVSAEERGQAEAIARSIEAGLSLKAPFIATIIGEGMSGGAIAIAAANRVYMLEHSIYSVISPEGASSILWRSADKAQEAATRAQDHGPGSAAAETDRRHRAGAGRRRPSRAAGGHRCRGRPDRPRPGRNGRHERRATAAGPAREISRHGPDFIKDKGPRKARAFVVRDPLDHVIATRSQTIELRKAAWPARWGASYRGFAVER